ncbi:MAG: D-alanyl-D-alanine carboxypeptidase [Nitrospinaceae bacterium]|jgi:serine-type D-Ala-D-Ala carboxypeptidase (penicillin-binding protein 5/6)|nr:D-alanyl-D-alanine carboxypeptidase [Nitrospinaceae bacterium]MBT3435138.1 D-alanyl-D-alanine carboxypeptidase [Nitrospinaceae bacterium]MBT3821211.1 D-alanyl-D-alanine carboxypeptidase [Nitrospinaceae bacterium]MBT4093917.1 D-alanyl-D-alanine carboxypeptidase [Nitrospinaceae bacterium]MBT4431576.1 D-alanyl-D-alanine carboxypeptidase [Nitrospinaceae bacterium]
MLKDYSRAVANLRLFLTITLSIFFIIISSTSNLEAKSAKKKSWPYRSALLIEADTGQILKSFQPRIRVIPASLVKMMTLLITLEQIKTKSVNIKDIVTTSRKASRIGGQQVYLRQGEKFSLEDLLKAVAISSANDAAYAVAEHIAGDSDIFVEMMNTRAKQLGMTDTSYVNVHGLPPGRRLPPNMTSARDMAIIARELLKYPITKRWGKTKHTPFRNGKFTLTNTNRLVGKFRGLDGLKTGSYRKAGYSIVATAKRGDLRLIAVVMSSSHPRRRFKEGRRLLAWGFANYSWYKGKEPGSERAFSVKVKRGQKNKIYLKSTQKFRKLVKRGQARLISVRKEIPTSIPAPIHEGQKVGRLIYELQGKKMGEVQLAATESVDRLSFFQTFIRLQ